MKYYILPLRNDILPVKYNILPTRNDILPVRNNIWSVINDMLPVANWLILQYSDVRDYFSVFDAGFWHTHALV